MDFLLSSVLMAQSGSGSSSGGGIGGCMVGLVYLAIVVAVIAGGWKMFVKAGQPGWGIIVPFYNAYLICKICGRPGWWFILLLIPIVSIIFGIIIAIDLAKSFGKGIGFALGLIFLGFIFVPILGFGSAQYQGPAAA